MSRYPHAPGYARGSSTSRAAAQEIAPEMRPLHRQIIGTLADRGPLTADEIAGRLGRHLLTIRPRLTELRELGLVERTADTRPSALGNGQHVLTLTDEGRQCAQGDRSDALHASTVAATGPDTRANNLDLFGMGV